MSPRAAAFFGRNEHREREGLAAFPSRIAPNRTSVLFPAPLVPKSHIKATIAPGANLGGVAGAGRAARLTLDAPIMTEEPSSKSIAFAMLSSARGKLISALFIVFLLLGIAVEGISLVTAYYNMLTAGAEMLTAGAEAQAKMASNRPTTSAMSAHINAAEAHKRPSR